MNLNEIIRHTVRRSIHKAATWHGDTLKIELPAVALIAAEIAAEVMELIEMYQHNGEV